MFVKKIDSLIVIIFLTFFSTEAHAYIGPGLALGAIVLTIGIVVLLLLAMIAILYYPIKKMIKNIKLKKLKK